MPLIFRTYTRHAATFVRHRLLLVGSLLAVGYLASCTHHEEIASRAQITFDFAPQTTQSEVPATRQGVKADSWMDHVTHTLPMHDAQGDSVMQVLVLSQDMADSIAPQTRAGAVTAGNMYPSFGVLTYAYPATGSWSESLKPNFMYNIEVTASSRYTTSYYWPGVEEKLSFFAYAPYNGTGIALSGQTATGTPKITYTVPSAVADQKDVLVAVSKDVPGNKRATEQLRFKHALTAVRVTTAANMLPGRITSVKLKNVYGKAVHAMGSASWSGHNTKTTFSQTLNQTVGGTAQDLVQGEATFMMLPQTLPTDAALEVTYRDDFSGQIHTLTAALGGKVWQMGKVATYQLSLSSLYIKYTFDTSAPTAFVNIEGETKTFTVTSKRSLMRKGTGGQSDTELHAVAVPFHFKWRRHPDSSDFTTGLPEGLSITQTVASPGVTNVTLRFAALPRESFDEELRHQPALTEIKDLSLNFPGTTGRTTANCYIVYQAGRYRIPVVYGNAIENGQTNEVAFKDGNGTDYNGTLRKHYRLNPLVNHVNQAISAPWLVDNAGVDPGYAKVGWQDAESLVTDVQLSADKKFIEFSIKKENIKQGNATIAVLTSGHVVLWSWHIWVASNYATHYTRLSNFPGYTMMNIPLGWCYTGNGYRRDKDIRFQIISDGGGSAERRLLQQGKAETTSTQGRAVYYQWGRKDPFVPSNVTSDYNSTWGVIGQAIGSSVGQGIQLPNQYLHAASNGTATNSWLNDNYNNLWNMKITWSNKNKYNAGTNREIPTKTIYDPSPQGCVVPPSGFAIDPGHRLGYINTTDRALKSYDKLLFWTSDFQQADRNGGKPWSWDNTGSKVRDTRDGLMIRCLRQWMWSN